MKFMEYCSTILTEGEFELKKNYLTDGLVTPQQYDELKALDPSPNKKYFGWLLKMFVKEHDISRLKSIVDFHNAVMKGKIKGKDSEIYQYKTSEAMSDKVRHVAEVQTGGEIDRAAKEGAKTVYENSNCKIKRIMTTDASIVYGSGTKWCIAASKSYNYFRDYYQRDGHYIYYVLAKKPVGNSLEKMAVTVCDPHDNGKLKFTYWNTEDYQLSKDDAVKHLKNLKVDSEVIAELG